MSRASESDIRAIIDIATSLEIAPMITAATALVDYVDSCDTDSVLSNALLKQIETYIAAHLIAQRDPQAREKWNDEAKDVYQGDFGMYFDSTHWGQTALLLDVSGCLNKLNEEAKIGGKKKAVLKWGGKQPINKLDFEDRGAD